MAEPSNSDCNNVQEENNAVVEEEEEVLTSISNANRGIETDDDDGPPTHQVGHEQSKVTAPAVLSSRLETIDDDDGPPTHHMNDDSYEKRKNTAAAVVSSQLETIDDDDGPPTYHVEDDSYEKRKNTAAAVISSQLEIIDDDDGPPSYQIEDDSHEKRKVTAAAVLSSQLETIEDDDDGPPTYHFDDDADQKRAAISSFSTNVEPNPPTSIVEDDSIQAKIAAYRITNEEKCEEGYDMSDDESISYEQSTINTMSNHIDEQGIITLNASVQVNEEEDIESGIQRESSSSSHSQTQVITGFLVGEEDDDIIIAGVAETILPWWKQRRAKLLITLFFTLLPIVVLLGYIIHDTISGERFLWNEYLRGYLVIILCCVSAVVMFAFCYGWNFGNFRLGQWEIVKDLRSSSSDTVESIVREEQRQQKIMLYYICLVLAFLVLGAVGLISIVLSRGYAYPLIFLPCGIALTSALIAILTYTSWKQTSRKMLIFLICISIPILVLVLLIGSLPFGIALSLFFITTLTYTSWKLKHGKILLPVLLILMMAIWGAFLLQSNSFYYGGDIPIVVCTLLLLVVFVSFCCWIVLNHIRSVPSKTAEDIEEKSADSPHSHDGAICTNEDDNEAQSQEEVGASTRSSIRRESSVPIIPEACLVEIEEEEEEEEDRVAGVAEPMSLHWEQIRGKVIRSSVCLICLFFVLGILIAGYFILANTYPLNQKCIDIPGYRCEY